MLLMLLVMSMEENRKIKELTLRIDNLEKRIEEIKKHVYNVENLLEKLVSSMTESGRYAYDKAVDTLKMAPDELDYTQKRIYDYLLSRGPVGVTAREVSKALGISRSHASAILNEFFREGVVEKIRDQREVKFVISKNKEEMVY